MSMRLAAFHTLLLATLLGGCVVLPDTGKTAERAVATIEPDALIARDFVNVLKQLDSKAPDRTTIDLHSAQRNDKFTQAMHDELKLAGYGTRWVQHRGSESLFQYRRSVERAAALSTSEVFELAIGSVEMRRGYATDGKQRVKPVTAFFLRGVDASHVVLSDTLFDAPEQVASTTLSAGNELGSATDAVTPEASANTEFVNDEQQSSALKVADEANPLNSSVGKAVAGSVEPLSLVNVRRGQNVYELGESNFGRLLAGHRAVDERALTFANDSMRLGDVNKRLVMQMVERFNPDTDVFSVLGCSMGPTRVKGGNAALALGRAGRVAEALRFAGVDDRHILDEGCWAGDGRLEHLPSRGVIIRLNRQS